MEWKLKDIKSKTAFNEANNFKKQPCEESIWINVLKGSFDLKSFRGYVRPRAISSLLERLVLLLKSVI